MSGPAVEERYARIFDSVAVMLAFTEERTGQIVDVNPAWLRAAQRDRAEVLGKTGRELGLWTDVGVRDTMMRELAADGRASGHETIVRLGRHPMPVRLSAELVELHGERFILWEIHDLTERRRAEAEEARLMSQLRERNEEMEQFVYTVSHDLKSPLVTISGFVGAIGAAVAAGDLETVAGDLARIGTAAERMAVLLDDLLALSRAGRPPATTRVALADVVATAIEQVAGRLAACGVEIRIIDELPEVDGDRGRLIQVVQNLLDNAAKFMGTQATPRIEIGTRPDPAVVCLYVRDNGIGIEPRHASRLFTLFEQLDPRAEGTGIGLALVARIVERHGGRVWAESEGEGHGTTFLMTLPRATQAA